MAFLPFSLLLSFILFAELTSAEPALLSRDAVVLQDHDFAALHSKAAELELHQLKSRISSLEIGIEEKIGELQRQDGSIKQLEKVIEEKLSSLVSLQSSEKGSLDEKKRMGEVKRRVNELEKQIVNLKKEIESQDKKKDELEARANVAEKKIEGLNLKFENLRRINDEQKLKMHKAQHALQVAEEEMLKAKLEASSVTKQLNEVHLALLPQWLSAHLVHFQSFVKTHWNEHARPALDLTIQKVLERKSEVEEWLQPHFETFRTKLFPIIKEHYKAFVDDFNPLMQSVSTQVIYYYNVTQSTIEPHMVKMLEIMDPYFQEAKMFTKPHIDQVSVIAKPHLHKARLFFKQYSSIVVHYHRKISKNFRIYHSLVQATLYETLNSYELTKPFARGELVWVMASVLMALPVIVLFRILPPRKEPKKHRRSTRTSHTRRRTKRVHLDK
ncbi:hypothetical protein ACJIZ3_018927 [Penstemon smallii]|uniref:Uncharacterized protein n=1 Tax=Penstemon smallii TaxID=265156 RepID=A0ABD3T0M3_9LAMI